MTGYLAIFSGGLLLVSALMLQRTYMDARKYFPLQFADEPSSSYYMQYVQFNRAIPWDIRRRLAIASALWIVAFAGFAEVAYVSGNPVIAVVLLLFCGLAIANIAWQWHSAKR